MEEFTAVLIGGIGPVGQRGGSGPPVVIYQQAEPEAIWRIAHGLGGPPSAVSLYDMSGGMFEAEIAVTDANTIEVICEEGLPEAGTAVILGSLPGFIPSPSSPGNAPIIFTQATPATEWVISHNLGRLPASIELYDEHGVRFTAEIIATDSSATVTMEAGLACAGKAVVI